MYNTLKISRYILEYAKEQGLLVTNAELQKILYYTQAEFLVRFEKPCFTSLIKAVENGVEISEVNDFYKQFGNNPIPVEGKEIRKGCVCALHREAIEDVVNRIAELEVKDLLGTLICQHDPWIKAFNSENKVIRKTDLYNFYKPKI